MKLTSIGVNNSKEKQFNNKGIYSVEDLLKFVPYKYLDYREPKKYSELTEDGYVAFVGNLTSIEEKTSSKGMDYLLGAVEDEEGGVLNIYWFHQGYVSRILKPDETYIFCGRVTQNQFTGKYQMSNPVFSRNIASLKKIHPVYSKISGMSDAYLKEKVQIALNAYKTIEPLSVDVLKDFDIPRLYEMARMIHEPRSLDDINIANKRMIFDELYALADDMYDKYSGENEPTDIACTKLDSVNKLLDSLPYKLTDGEDSQLETVRKIVRKMRKGIRTKSLVQGDVGCGKTAVAILLMLILADNGYQACLMAPTNVLATQHYENICETLKIFDFVHPVLLTGSLTAKQKKAVLAQIQSGEANLVIGTHAVVSDGVEFKNLALSIVDEEHRFGVEQRKAIADKNKNVHTVSMSATPIPRTLGVSLYGDNVDIYNITQMPNGRKPIKTIVTSDSDEAYELLRNEVRNGRQGYVICPLIEESDSETMADIESVETTYKNLCKYFKNDSSIKVGMINGNMKQAVVAEELEKFASNEYNIIVSTTIVEVGVNVPNASVIIIKNAERFGLAQLHQLRGRVGRGQYQSYCVLCSEKSDTDRLKIMAETNDGFKIAEKDLALRGMGDLVGTKQSGDYRNVMLMLGNQELFGRIKELVKKERGNIG